MLFMKLIIENEIEEERSQIEGPLKATVGVNIAANVESKEEFVLFCFNSTRFAEQKFMYISEKVSQSRVIHAWIEGRTPIKDFGAL